jgi:SAM-dependent methyltransferase
MDLTLTPSHRSREAFHSWCRDGLFTPALRRGLTLADEACDLHIQQIYLRLQLHDRLQTPMTGDEVARELGYVETAGITMEALLGRLARRTGFVRAEGVPPRFQAVQEPPDVTAALRRVRSEVAELGEGYLAATDFMEFGATNFEVALRDDPDMFDRILSGRDAENAELWFRATNTDPTQDVHGQMGAEAILALFDGGSILELGGGTGNGIRHLLNRFEAEGELGRIQEYIFTDISLQFILGTRHEIGPRFPSLKTAWRYLDINEPFWPQKVPPGSVDLIYAVNAAHVARDIVAMLKECRRTLRPGGRVLFAERVRFNEGEMAPRELSLNLSIYHRTAAIRNSEYRPVHCYLAPAHWLKVLELAGFEEAEVLPDYERIAPPVEQPYAAVVTAVRTADA